MRGHSGLADSRLITIPPVRTDQSQLACASRVSTLQQIMFRD
jgi:hypothetical protein